jgi:hypothetical protein
MWLHRVSESGKARRHAHFFVRRAEGTGVLVNVRPANRNSDVDSAVFVATAVMAGQAGCAYKRVAGLPAVRAANLRWLAGYRHPRYARYARAAVMAALAEVCRAGPTAGRCDQGGRPTGGAAGAIRHAVARRLDAQVLDRPRGCRSC